MSDNDMLRRGDAHRTIVLTGEHVVGMKSSAVIDHICVAIRALPAVQPGKEVMPDATRKVCDHDTAPAGNLTAGGGAGQMADTPMITGLVTRNLTARGNAATWALYDANLTRMGALQHAVQPDAALLEAACIAAHDAYEVAAHAAGWVTNPQSRKLWSEVPEANKIAMRAGISAALALIDKPAHVNETPKSEHDAANMLTPATKGGDA